MKVNNIAVAAMVTRCSVSHDTNGSIAYAGRHVCANVMDGSLDTLWATDVITVNEWIQLDFTDMHTVFRVDIYHLCKNGCQCNGLHMTFSDNSVISVSNLIHLKLRLKPFVHIVMYGIVIKNIKQTKYPERF